MARLIRPLAVFLLLTTLALSGPAPAQPPAAKPQTICPVMGGKINRQVYVDHQGQRIYFCCPACIELFRKNPEKYLQEMNQAGVTPEKAPAGK